MLTKSLFFAAAFVVSSGIAVLQPGASPAPAPQPAQQTAPATPAVKKKEPPTLAAIFKDQASRKAMGLDKLTPEEQQRLAENIAAFAAPIREFEARASLLRHEAVQYLTAQGWEEDPIRKMENEGWSEVEVVGTATIKGDKYSLDREVLAVKVMGRKNYYGSGFRDEISRFDKINLRSGTMWGKDMFRSLTIIGMDGTEIELKKVDVDTWP
ncbi:MAG: hypothetical protein KF787_11020 [Phycisphaeraceae bacterium]|nr:hypothetical protein [Phycisphaeraceae bacterium]